MIGHLCNANPAKGLVCSHLLDSEGEILSAMGFPVEKTDKICGSKVVTREGSPFGRARHQAWQADLVRICTKVGS